MYDYSSKYVKGSTEYLCPAPISDALSSVIRSVCLRAFELTGCRGWVVWILCWISKINSGYWN